MKDWNRKKVLITGATSGLGWALALELARSGAEVIGVARGKDGLERLRNAAPGIRAIAADVSDKRRIHPLAGEIEADGRSVDAIFNVASALGPVPLKLLLDTECEDFESVLQTNLLGPFRLSKALLPGMILNGGGVIVNISSDAAFQAYPRWGAYSASKAALDRMSKVWDEELKEHRVRVHSIDPGDMNTPMHFAAIPDADPARLLDPKDAARILLERIGKAGA